MKRIPLILIVFSLFFGFAFAETRYIAPEDSTNPNTQRYINPNDSLPFDTNTFFPQQKNKFLWPSINSETFDQYLNFKILGGQGSKITMIKNGLTIDINLSDLNFSNIDVNIANFCWDANLLNGVPGSGYIRTDGSSTTTQPIPFAEGITIPDLKKLSFNNKVELYMNTIAADFYFIGIDSAFGMGSSIFLFGGRALAGEGGGVGIGGGDGTTVGGIASVTGGKSQSGNGGNATVSGGTSEDANGGNVALKGGTGGTANGIVIVGAVTDTSSHNLNNYDDLKVSGKLEIDGNTYIDERICFPDTTCMTTAVGGLPADMNLQYYTQLDANVVLVKKSDFNSLGDQRYSKQDSNWQTSFNLLDANLALSYYKQSDANTVLMKKEDMNAQYVTTNSSQAISASKYWNAQQNFNADLNLQSKDLQCNGTIGCLFGKSNSEKWGFWGTTPVTQPLGSVDVLAGLVTIGLRAASSNPPLDLGTGKLTCGVGAFSNDITLTSATPSFLLVDSDLASDDWSLNVNASVLTIRNDTDSRNDITINGTGDVNFGTKFSFRTDGNITLTSPNGTKGNCGMTNGKVFQCS